MNIRMNDSTHKDIKDKVNAFFHDFAWQTIMAANADPDNPQAVKMALIDHLEEIYPRFSTTEIFRRYNGTALHEIMVEEYRGNFSLLLSGILP